MKFVVSFQQLFWALILSGYISKCNSWLAEELFPKVASAINVKADLQVKIKNKFRTNIANFDGSCFSSALSI